MRGDTMFHARIVVVSPEPHADVRLRQVDDDIVLVESELILITLFCVDELIVSDPDAAISGWGHRMHDGTADDAVCVVMRHKPHLPFTCSIILHDLFTFIISLSFLLYIQLSIK